ncbi:MAG TPA: LCP family protein [Candidatus Nitrosocosmicus sp.]|nr:LCP family protein [Candidatus Nitrosocosmicus sp.]
MKKYIAIFLASFLVFFIILGGVYYLYKSNMTDEHFVRTIEENPELKPEDPKEDMVINTLFMGIDEARSDTMIVASYNKENQRITLLSIPRDSRVEIPGYGYDKINSAAARKEGTALAMKTVENLLGIPIHHYVKVTFKGAEKIVDIVGGVKVDVPPGVDYDDPAQNLSIHIKPGLQVLNGKDAVKFARFRKGYADQDLGRIKAQQQLIKAFIDKLTSPQMIPKALSLVDAMSKCVKTNLDNSTIAGYAVHVKDIKMENIKFYTLPGHDEYKNKVSYFLHDEEKLKEMMKQIQVDLGVEEGQANDTTSSKTGSTEAAAEEKTISRDEIKVQILNGSKKSGLALQLKNELQDKGYSNIKIGDTKDMTYGYSRVIDRSGNKEMLDVVSKDSSISIVESDIDITCGYDITVIIGKDRINGGM